MLLVFVGGNHGNRFKCGEEFEDKYKDEVHPLVLGNPIPIFFYHD